MMKKVFYKDSKQSLPVNTIFCIGRNYAAHAAELNNPLPQSPIVFIKPLTTLIYGGDAIQLPQASRDVHHEVEMVVLIGKPGKHISREAAAGYISGYGIGIDVTARDIQQRAKEKAHPWTVAKGFDTFAPVSDFVAPDRIADPHNLEVTLSINGDIRQAGNTNQMMFRIDMLIAYLSSIFTLSPGDLIFTGTPEGVGPLQHGDRLHASLGSGIVELKVSVERAAHTG